MAALHDALAAVTAGIEAAIGDPRVDVASHPGRFTEAELERLILKQRAVRVGIEQVAELQTQGPGQVRAQILFAAFVVCGDSLAAPRHQAALALTDTLLAALPYQRWGVSYLTAVLPAASHHRGRERRPMPAIGGRVVGCRARSRIGSSTSIETSPFTPRPPEGVSARSRRAAHIWTSPSSPGCRRRRPSTPSPPPAWRCGSARR